MTGFVNFFGLQAVLSKKILTVADDGKGRDYGTKFHDMGLNRRTPISKQDVFRFAGADRATYCGKNVAMLR